MRALARDEVEAEVRYEAVEMVLADMRTKVSETGDFGRTDWAEDVQREYGLPREKK